MGNQGLFGDLGSSEKSTKKERGSSGPPRVKRPDRRQSLMRAEVLDQLLPPEHRARAIVAAVEQLDLTAFYDRIGSRGTDPGRPATDPAMLLSLWLFAISEGVGSARQLERLCDRDDAYRWICGGVQVNHHTLSDFRIGYEKELDGLMTEVLAVLLQEGLVSLKRVAQDGVRVRAHAGAASFRRARSLKKCLKVAKEQVRATKRLVDQDDPTRSDRQRAAAERAARDREERVRRALEQLPKVRESKESEEEKAEARVSTTDPDARVMRMADGGYRPAYNIQFATATDGRAIVGVRVTNSGSDMQQITPMLEEIERRTGKRPADLLVDGGFSSLDQIRKAGEAGVTVFAPLPKSRSPDADPRRPKRGDDSLVAAWRRRMCTARAKQIYKQRGETAECTNADLRTHRGLHQLPVRGTNKVWCVALLMAITFNVLKWINATPLIA